MVEIDVGSVVFLHGQDTDHGRDIQLTVTGIDSDLETIDVV